MQVLHKIGQFIVQHLVTLVAYLGVRHDQRCKILKNSTSLAKFLKNYMGIWSHCSPSKWPYVFSNLFNDETT